MNLKRLKQIKDNDEKVIVAKWIHAYCPRVDLSFIKDIVEYYWDNKFTVEQNTEKYAKNNGNTTVRGRRYGS